MSVERIELSIRLFINFFNQSISFIQNASRENNIVKAEQGDYIAPKLIRKILDYFSLHLQSGLCFT